LNLSLKLISAYNPDFCLCYLSHPVMLVYVTWKWQHWVASSPD